MLRVLLSPSKEQSYKEEAVDDMKMLPFLKQTKTLVNHIQAFSKEDLGKIMNIKMIFWTEFMKHIKILDILGYGLPFKHIVALPLGKYQLRHIQMMPLII